MRPVALILAAAAVLPGCAAAPAPSGSGQQADPSSDVTRYFPLVDGHIYQYATRTDEGDDGILTARAFRPDRAHAELRIGRSVKRFEYTAEGIEFADARGTFVLQAPLVPGTSWRGEHGRARVVATGVAVTVPAGSFADCVQVVEERLGDRPMRTTTTFCPDVGIAVLETATSAGEERAELRMFGPPIELGPDGLRRLP